MSPIKQVFVPRDFEASLYSTAMQQNGQDYLTTYIEINKQIQKRLLTIQVFKEEIR